MAIYTKTGDKGQTSIFGGKRVPKYDPQVEAYGAIDEASSFIGWALEEIHDEQVRKTLTDVQFNLYKIMAYLAGAGMKDGNESISGLITILEQEIDHLDKTLPKLTRFILPQGSESSSRLHICRTKVRTSERRVVYFVSQKEENAEDEVIVKFLNRLSDWFFMVARKFSQDEKVT